MLYARFSDNGHCVYPTWGCITVLVAVHVFVEVHLDFSVYHCGWNPNRNPKIRIILFPRYLVLLHRVTLQASCALFMRRLKNVGRMIFQGPLSLYYGIPHLFSCTRRSIRKTPKHREARPQLRRLEPNFARDEHIHGTCDTHPCKTKHCNQWNINLERNTWRH